MTVLKDQVTYGHLILNQFVPQPDFAITESEKLSIKYMMDISQSALTNEIS